MEVVNWPLKNNLALVAMQQHLRGPHLTIKLQGSHNLQLWTKRMIMDVVYQWLPLTSQLRHKKEVIHIWSYLELHFFFTVLVEANHLSKSLVLS